MNLASKSVSRLTNPCYLTAQGANLQTGIRGFSTSQYATQPTQGAPALINQSMVKDKNRGIQEFANEARFVQNVIRTSKRPAQIQTTKRIRSNTIDSPLSPGERPEPKTTVNMHKRKFSTASAMQLSHLPGIVQPEIESSSPSFQYHETWSYLKRNEPNMVVQAILDLAENGYLNLSETETKVLDFGVSNGEVGEIFNSLGFTQLYGQEGSEHQRNRSLKKGHYKSIESFIVGKHSMPAHLTRAFDIVSCSGNLGVGLMPSQGLLDMVKALKQGGIAVFTINEKMLDPETDKGTGYNKVIQKLVEEGAWKEISSSEGTENKSKVMIFQKL